MEKQAVTIYDVAERAGVSMATVSRVVNGNANVRPSTRKKVLKIIEELDYRPNAVARGLASKKTTTVGIIMPSINNTFFANLATGINDIAMMYHYDILVSTFEPEDNHDVTVFNSLLAKQVDGIIYLGYELSESLRIEFERSTKPIVLAGTTLNHHHIASVNINHQAMTYDACHYLMQRNEKTALVTGPLVNHINGHEILRGYKQALNDLNLPYSEGLVFESYYTLEAAEKIVDRIVQSGATAAFVTDDLLAAGILNALLDRNIRIPEDFEIISSANMIYTELTRPKISSIQHPLYDTGAVAMRLLTKMMTNEPVEDKNILLPYSLKLKQSTK